MAKPFIDNWEAIRSINVVMPVPSSNQFRPFQPANEIAQGIVKYLGKPFVNDVLGKLSIKQSKDMAPNEKEGLKGTITLKKRGISELNILLVDDLYQTGSTLCECVRVLRMDPYVKHVYVLAMSKTKG